MDVADGLCEEGSSSSSSSSSSQSSSPSSSLVARVAAWFFDVEVEVIVIVSGVSASAGVVTVEVGSAREADDNAAAEGVQSAGRSDNDWVFLWKEWN